MNLFGKDADYEAFERSIEKTPGACFLVRVSHHGVTEDTEEQ
jgi:hypothetical protein